MRRLLLLLAACAVFAACDDDPIDYSTWTTEELLATPGGVDYLIDTAAPIDYAAIEEELETMVFDPYYFFVYDDRDGWYDSQDSCDGPMDLGTYVVVNDAVRHGFMLDYFMDYRTPEGERVQYAYREKKFTGDRLKAVLDFFGGKIKARIEHTLVVEEYDRYDRRWLYLVRLTDDREEVLQQYRYNWDDLIPYKPVH